MYAIGAKIDLFVTLVGSCDKLVRLFAHVDFEKSHDLETLIADVEEGISSGVVGAAENLQIGQVHVAKFQEDGKWYRAEVLKLGHSVGDAESVEVKFIDYGNIEVVSIANVRQCPKELESLPPLAVEFYLADIQSKNAQEWQGDELEFVSERLAYGEFKGIVVSAHKNIPVVQILEPDSETTVLAQKLVGEGHGKNLPLDFFKNDLVNSVTNNTPQGKITGHIPLTELDPGIVYDVYVSYAETPLSFWIQLASEEDKLSSLMDTLANENLTTPLSNVVEGVACAAVFSEDGGCYRGSVGDIHGENCRVHFVDYGNSEKQQVNGLTSLPSELMALPQQAIPCSLNGVSSENVTADLITKFQDLTVDASLKMKAVSKAGDKYGVELLHAEKGIILDLLDLRHGAESSVSRNSSSASSSLKTSPSRPSKESELEIGSIEDLCISYVDKQGIVYCHLLRHAMVLDKFVTALNEAHANPSMLRPANTERGELYAVKCVRDGNWCRGEIINVTPEGVDVFLVDFGHREILPNANVAALEHQFLVLPYQAIKCVLNGIANMPFTAKQLAYLNKLESRKILVAKVMSKQGDAFAVDLYDTSGVDDIHINAILSEEPSPERVDKLPMQRTVANVVVKPPQVQIGGVESLYVTSVQSSRKLAGQLTKCPVEVLDKLQADLEKSYSTSSPGFTGTPSVNNFCCTQFSDDGAWYRAQITSFKGKDVDVCFIDYGNHEMKSTQDLKVLLPQFSEPSQIAINFSLANLESVPTKELADALLEQNVMVRVVSKKDTFYSAELADVRENTNINKQLARFTATPSGNPRHAEVRSPNRQQAPQPEETFKEPPRVSRSPMSPNPGRDLASSPRVNPRAQIYQVKRPAGHAQVEKLSITDHSVPTLETLEVEDGEYLDVFVVFSNSPNDFYCQLVKNANMLKEMMQAVQQRYGKLCVTDLVCEDIRPGTFCMARFSEDQEWYRAEILNTSGRWVEAYFVDYGNKEKIDPADVKQILPEFLSVPAQAIKCSLFGVLPTSGTWSAEEKEKFESLVANNLVGKVESVDRHGTCMIELIDVKQKDLNINRVIGGENFISPKVSLASTPSVSARSSPGRQLVEPGRASQERMPPVRRRSEAALLPEMNISSGQTAEVMVSWAISPQEFWCQLVSKQSELEELMDGIHEHYGSLPQAKEAELNLVKGVFCIAQFSQDEGWYRAQICGYHGNQVDVMFVDYGNTETVSRTVVKTIAPEFCQLPMQAVKCSIRGVAPVQGEWTSKAATLIEQLATKGNFTCKFLAQHQETYLVDLEMQDGTSVAEALCNEGIARRAPGSGSNRSHASSGGASARSMRSQDIGRSMRGNKPARPSPARGTDSPPRSFDQRGGGDHRFNDRKDRDARPKTGQDRAQRSDRSHGAAASNEESSWGVESNSNKSIHTATKLTYTYEKLDIDTYVDFTVTHVDSVQSFYCQLNKMFEKIEAVMDKLESHYKSLTEGDAMVSNPVVGQPCGAKFSEDNGWYRAEITQVKGSQVRVHFVDYGNSEMTTMNAVRKMTGDLIQLPVQGVECCMVDLPSRVSNEVEERFKELVLDHHVVGRICSKKGHMYEVELTQTDGDNLVINEELVKLMKSAVQVPDVSSSSDVPDASYKMADFQLDVLTAAYVSHVVSPAKFYIQLADIDATLAGMTEKLQEVYENSSNLQIMSSLKVGQPCCCRYTEDEAWYRGKVSELSGSNVTVLFVDYGNSEMTTADNVYQLSLEFLGYPLMAIEAGLQHVDATGDEMRTKLEEMTQDKELMVKFLIREPCSVEMFDGELNIGNALVKCGGSSIVEETSVVSDVATHPVGNSALVAYIPLEVSIGIRKVYVSHVESPSHFYVQPVDIEEKLNQMMEEIEEKYGGSVDAMSRDQITVDLPCCAKYSSDGAWYRAKVIAVSGDEIEVIFVDYGNTDKVDSADIRALTPELLSIPVMAVHCFIDGYGQRTSWSDELIDRFVTVTQDIQVDAEFVSITEPYLTKLSDEEGDISSRLTATDAKEDSSQVSETTTDAQYEPVVSESTGDVASETVNNIEEGPTEQESTSTTPVYTKLSLKSGQKEQVYISHTESAGDFWCQLASTEDALVDLMVEMVEHYGSLGADDSVLVTADVGTPCAAKYSADGEWYRAEIVSCDADKSCKVLFVDYGNTDSGTLSELKVLDPKFAGLECQAFHCRLVCDNLAQRSWGEDDTPKFEELTADKKLLLEVVSVHDQDSVMDVKLLDVGISIASKLINFDVCAEAEDKDSISPPQANAGDINNEVSDSTTQDASVEGVSVTETPVSDEPESATVEETSVLDESVGNLELACTDAVGVDVTPVPLYFKYTLPGFVAGTKEEVYTCNVTNPSQFWVQLKKYLPLLETLMDKIFETYNSIESSVMDAFDDCPEVASPCVAKFSEDGLWYRASVVSVCPPDVQVCYVDYGNTETVGFKDIRQLQTRFSLLPRQASECALFGVRADESAWNQETIDYFNEVVADKCLIMDVVEVGDDDCCLVRLLDMGMLVSDKLIAHNVAVDIKKPLELKRRGSKDYEYSPKLVEGETVDVFVVSTSNEPTGFWCQLASSEEELPLLMDRVHEHYSQLSGDIESLELFSEGRPCIAQYSEDESWYRAVITEVRENDAQVCFVDYGNSQRVARSLIKSVRPDLLMIPPQAFLCELAGAFPIGSSWDAASRTRFEELTFDKELKAEILQVEAQENMLKATIKLMAGESAIADLLVDGGYARRSLSAELSRDPGIGQDSEVTESPELTTDVGECVPSAELSTTESSIVTNGEAVVEGRGNDSFQPAPCVDRHDLSVEKLEQQVDEDVSSTTGGVASKSQSFRFSSLEVDQQYSVIYSMGESPDHFTCRLLSTEAGLDEVTATIQDYCSEEVVANASGYDAGVGEACLAQWPEDECWYRSIVIGQEEDDIKVNFVDFGNSDVVAASCLRAIPARFLDFPAQGIQMKLAGVSVVDKWSSEATTLFEDFMHSAEEEFLTVQVDGVEDRTYSVYVYNPKVKDETSLNYRLVQGRFCSVVTGSLLEKSDIGDKSESEVASNSKVIDNSLTEVSATHTSINDITLTTGQTVELIFLSASDPDNIVGQLLESVDALTDLMQKLLNLYSNESDYIIDPSDVKPGVYCSALYSEDDTWYRAEITQVTGEKAEVYFVDFGDRDTVDVKNKLRVLPDEFRTLPAQAVRCSLADMKPPGVAWQDATISTIEETCLSKLLIVDITSVDEDGRVIGNIRVKDRNAPAGVESVSLQKVLLDKNLAVPADAAEDLSELDSSIVESASDLNIESNDELSVASSEVSCDTPACQDLPPVELIFREYKPDEKFEAVLSHVISPSQFWLQVDSDKLENFMETIQESYSTGKKVSLTDIKEEMPCCVQYSEDLKWYRSKVQSCYGDVVTVQFVDYGNSETTVHSNVTYLKPKFAKEPVFAIQASLSGVEPSGVEWSDKASETLEELCENEVFAKVTDVSSAGLISVDITMKESGDSLQEQLVRQELARHSGLAAEA